MNHCYYLALARAPMGVVVAIEFLGPLSVATFASRRAIDGLWIALAALGLLLLTPLAHDAAPLDPLGIVYALLAGACWGLYIVFGTRVGAELGARSVAAGMIIAALLVLPFGAGAAGAALLNVAVIPLALVVALLSSALPYVLEMYAMTRIPTRTFGILMSLEPALAALVGLVMLGERLRAPQWLAVGCVMLASFGSAMTTGRVSEGR